MSAMNGAQRVLQVHHDRVLVPHLHVLDRDVEEAPALGLSSSVVDRELDVGGGHRLAVREADPSAQAERVPLAAVGDRSSRWRATADTLAVWRGRVQRLVDLLDQPERFVLEDVRLVERLRVLDASDPKLTAPLRSLGFACARREAEGCGHRERESEGEGRGDSPPEHAHSLPRETCRQDSCPRLWHTWTGLGNGARAGAAAVGGWPCSEDRVPAVDRQDLAGHPRRLLGREEEDAVRDVLGRP